MRGRRIVGRLTIAGLVTLSFSLLPSCSGDESSSSGSGGDTGDSGVGGTSGLGGFPGSGGGAGVLPMCYSDDQCDNGVECDGVETCNGFACQPGTPEECVNPNAVHCSVQCQSHYEPKGCVVRGSDDDGDGHGDAKCSATTPGTLPGDDCDDANADVYPGAAETCNGLDDDCDGKDDLQDGLPLYGDAQLVVSSPAGAYQPAIAWGSDSYGLAWTDERDGAPRIYFALMNAGGNLTTTPAAISTTGSRPTIAYNGNEFLVAFAGGMQRISAAGAPLGGSIPLSAAQDGWPNVAWTGSHWLVTYDRSFSGGRSIRGVSVSATGTVSAETTLSSNTSGLAGAPYSAFAGGTLDVVWDFRPSTSPELDTIGFGRTDAALSVLSEGDIATPPPVNSQPRIGDGGAVFQLVWRRGPAARYVSQDPAGSTVCGPVDVGSSEVGSDLRPQSVVPNEERTLVLFQDGVGGGAALRLARFGADCSFIDSHDVAAGAELVEPERSAGMARGAAGYAIVWAQGSGAARALYARVLGPHLCDAPK